MIGTRIFILYIYPYFNWRFQKAKYYTRFYWSNLYASLTCLNDKDSFDGKIFLNSNFFLTIKNNYSRMATDGGYRALY